MKNCDSHSPYTYCIFQQPWWLDAVAPGSWDIVEIQRNNKVLARLPYTIEYKWGLKLLMMPPLTQVLGPWLADIQGKYATRLSREKELFNELFDWLPKFDYFKHNFHYTLQNWLPLYWKGFKQSTRYTYVLENLSDLDGIWQNFEGSTRREIRKARKQLTVHQENDSELMWRMHMMTFDRQGEKPDVTFEQFKRIDNACKSQNARKIFVARDRQNRIHAALYLIWDVRSAYYLMGGADPKLRSSGASSLLMWEAIRYSSQVSQTFDFEGSMIEPIERFFRGFGARQKPYFQISKMSRKMSILRTSQDLFQTILPRSLLV